MLKYAKIENEETKVCSVGLGTNTEFYKSIGMTEMDVIQAYDGQWYLKGHVPQKPQELIAQEALAKAKFKRASEVSKITVEVDGLIFDGDEESQTRMGRTIAAAIALDVDIQTYTQVWVLADNTVATVTIAQLAQALKLSGEAQTALWTKPYEGDNNE